MKLSVTRSIDIAKTPRLLQMAGMFDLPPSEKSDLAWDVELSLPAKWNVGAIVGPSGSGKSTIAAELADEFDERLIGGKDAAGNDVPPWKWPADRCILDGFPGSMGIKEITALLSSVGFSSPPAWVRPFRCLSNGQQFRVNLARTLAEATIDRRPKLVDEYASLVHEEVAQIGSAAVAKTARRYDLQFVAVTWRRDILPWLEPDWVLFVEADGSTRFELNANGDSRRWVRPDLRLRVIRVDPSAWHRLFHVHHYLSGELHKSASCFVGCVEGKAGHWEPAAFTAVLSFPHPQRPAWREHRTVCLPDFQGVGIGNAMSEAVASLFAATGKRFISTTSNPAMIRHRCRSPLWKVLRKPGLATVHRGSGTGMSNVGSTDRITAGFEYVGAVREREARRFGLIPARLV
jgi:ABC-type thiamine transport system ATPase subunit